SRRLHAEAAADILADHPQLAALDADDGRELIAQQANALRACAQAIAFRRVIGRGGAARLHRGDDNALIDERKARDMLGGTESALDLAQLLGIGAERPIGRDIPGCIGEELWRA